MSLMDFFRGKQKNSTAATAKERLQIIVAHERGRRNQPDYLPQLHKDIIAVIR
ncbi:MAG: cell division topological specificity factor MinE, partial [Moraxellaceae bacterium]|nr:cell division topological specificity factor MinE [Moraxellaceae bacterium]